MRAPRAVRLFTLAAALTVAGWSCSSSGKRDQFYGTDVGVGWIPGDGSALLPDAAAPSARLDGGADGAGDADDAAGADSSEAGAAADAAMSDTGG
jgi:hypothetical protein